MATRKSTRKKKTFKLMQYQMIVSGEIEIGQNNTANKVTAAQREYVCVDTGLTWTDAQDARRKDQSLIIVPEARVYKKRAVHKAKVTGETGESAIES